MRNFGKEPLILAFVAVGFLTTLVEVRYLHRGAVREYAVAWIPTISSGVALLASLAGLAPGAVWKKVSAITLAVVALAGLLGVYFHTKLKPAAFLQLFEAAPKEAPQAPAPDDFAAFEKEAEKESATAAPALAPLGITGLAFIGAIAAWPRGSRRDH